MRKYIVVGILDLSMLSAGCTPEPHNPTDWVTNQTVFPSSLPAPVTNVVNQLCAKFGDSHPQIVSAVTDFAEGTPPQKPMYDIKVQGEFTNGNAHLGELNMIVLADGTRGGTRMDNKSWDWDYIVGQTTR